MKTDEGLTLRAACKLLSSAALAPPLQHQEERAMEGDVVETRDGG